MGHMKLVTQWVGIFGNRLQHLQIELVQFTGFLDRSDSGCYLAGTYYPYMQRYPGWTSFIELSKPTVQCTFSLHDVKAKMEGFLAARLSRLKYEDVLQYMCCEIDGYGRIMSFESKCRSDQHTELGRALEGIRNHPDEDPRPLTVAPLIRENVKAHTTKKRDEWINSDTGTEDKNDMDNPKVVDECTNWDVDLHKEGSDMMHPKELETCIESDLDLSEDEGDMVDLRKLTEPTDAEFDFRLWMWK